MLKRIVALFTMFLVVFGAGTAHAESETSQCGTDIMIICAHPGDEYLFLGGALPIYVGEQGRSAVVVYLSSENEAQREQAKQSLSVYGDRVQAVFGEFSYAYTSTKDDATKYWDLNAVVAYMVGVIRQYKPAIVITHDRNGEYGHGAHYLTFDAAYQAVPFAAEAGRFAESSALYGAWRVQRFFSHLYGDNPVALDRSQPMTHFDGMSALELDQACYQTYEKTYPIKMTDGDGYTCAKYGLVSAVEGTEFDPTRGDLFAGIDESILTPKVTPAPKPTETPAPTPQPETGAQAQEPQQTVQAQEPVTTGAEAGIGLWLILLIASGTLTLAAAALAIFLKKEAKAKRVFLFVCAGLLVLSAIFAGMAFLRKPVVQEDEKTVEAPSAMPEATATPASSEAPAEPTPTPHPWAEYFRQPSDPAEVVIMDPQNEHWEYRSDDLSILVDRVHTARANGDAICYCVANIYMRNEDAFQAGVRNDNPHAAPGLEHAWHMARRYRAVLGITGDNLIQAEVADKGILMRNGKIYSINQGQDTLAFFPDTLSMDVFHPKATTPQALLDQGVLNTFSFGPTLLYNGTRDTKSRRGNLGRQNPRSGIGMVEPGHFVAITVDGRQKGYSVGMSMDELTQLFYSYGCQIAYNLDGGSSVAMIFMGECLNQHSGVGSDVQRPWTDGLLWGKSELVPSVDDPIYNDGSQPWVMPPEGK